VILGLTGRYSCRSMATLILACPVCGQEFPIPQEEVKPAGPIQEPMVAVPEHESGGDLCPGSGMPGEWRGPAAG